MQNGPGTLGQQALGQTGADGLGSGRRIGLPALYHALTPRAHHPPLQQQALPGDPRQGADRQAAGAGEAAAEGALGQHTGRTVRIMQGMKTGQQGGIVCATFHADGPLAGRGQTQILGQGEVDAPLLAKAAQAGLGQEDGMEFPGIQPAQTAAYVAVQVDNVQIGALGQQLGAAAQAGGADPGARRQPLQAVGRGKTAPGAAHQDIGHRPARQDHRQHQTLRQTDLHVLHGMHRQIRAPVQQAIFQLLDEQGLATVPGRGAGGEAIPLCHQGQECDTQTWMRSHKARADMICLPEGQRAFARGDGDVLFPAHFVYTCRHMKLGIVMDPIGDIRVAKDSTLAILLAAQKRAWELFYMELADLHLRDGQLLFNARPITVRDDRNSWYQLGTRRTVPAGQLDGILMRKDPPVDIHYIHATQLLERAEVSGTPVYNKPQALRAVNEKLFVSEFREFMPPTLVSCQGEALREFAGQQGRVVLKPLNAMGGSGVFHSHPEDANFNVIVETLTDNGTRHIMAQQYLPAIADGDKRILLIDGQPIPWALARIPGQQDPRGNLARGAQGRGQPLSASDQAICERLGPRLRAMGLLFCGLDVIGEHLTEINVTSPTCIRELDAEFDLDIAGSLLDSLQQRLQQPAEAARA